MGSRKVTIGSRGSPLALWQANWVKDLLSNHHSDLDVDIKIIKTSGDKIQNVPLSKIGGKGLFVKEIEEGLLRREIDYAVHSMKDMPISFPMNLCIACVTKRENPFDALISRNNTKLNNLPRGAKIGTGSLRRMSQLMHYRPDFNLIPLRGNLDTRLKKIESEGLDAIILAAAGLIRLGWDDRITEIISPEILLPAMGQGVVGVETRKNDVDNQILLADMDHEETHYTLDAERALVSQLEGGCNVPIGSFATLKDDQITLTGVVASLDGKIIYKKELTDLKTNAIALGRKIGNELIEMGADQIIKEIQSN